ncbi:hypothetical protein C0Q70_16482 [Pomacea canaliculata]|uniref:Uncharacterized protein n=1 Tax=Pomacea canaliculata TaxID=400727 RepID=A0A2T7NPX0_POMCA|nr:hypothetical protein C0Q70_16482 [Pomacea canaliculata]
MHRRTGLVKSISTKEVMSAAKMVADSTQSDVTGDQQENKRKRHRRDKKSRKDSRKRRVSASPDSGSGEGGSASDEFDSDADLKKELKPLHAFLGDRTAFLDEMLRSVRGSSLQRALPAKLRDMPPEELRRRCLEQLQVMSRKRIKRIMAGDDPAVISSSSTEDEIIVWRGRERSHSGQKLACARCVCLNSVEYRDTSLPAPSPLQPTRNWSHAHEDERRSFRLV